MISLRYLFVALLVPVALISCGAFQHFDSRNPTVSQQDAYDVSWGLPPRKSRGNPKLKYQYDARKEYSAPVSAAPAAGPSVPVSVPSAAPSAAPAPISPTIPSNLR